MGRVRHRRPGVCQRAVRRPPRTAQCSPSYYPTGRSEVPLRKGKLGGKDPDFSQNRARRGRLKWGATRQDALTGGKDRVTVRADR